MVRKIFSGKFFIFFIAGFFCFASHSFAAFNLTVNPVDGSFDLRFTRLSPGDFKQAREVIIRANSDIGKQYRVSQNIITPLATMDGTVLADSQFKMYALVNSNTSGTLVYREETPVNEFGATLYTSNGAGDNDSFKLVYTVTPTDTQMKGSYYGRIAYILTPIDSNQSQVVVNMNVYVELGAGSVPTVEVSTNTGMNRLVLSSKGMSQKNESAFKDNPQVSIKVRSPLGVPYRIYQSFESGNVMSGSGEEFDLTKILFTASGGQNGRLTSEGDLAAAKQKQLIYTSGPEGSESAFIIAYKPAQDFRFAKTSDYRTKLNFVMEKDGTASAAPEVVGSLDVEINIVPLFEMIVFSNGEEGVNLKFDEVSYKTGPKACDVDVYAESNMGRPYQIIQKVAGPMMNERSEKIPEKDFTLEIKKVDSKKELNAYVTNEAPVKDGESVIFSSGLGGESAHLKVKYRLTIHSDTKSGNYSTQIFYSLSML
ncbi:MAG: hypothetical protein AAB213_04435 [Candidatus Omnitrophota bacterium]